MNCTNVMKDLLQVSPEVIEKYELDFQYIDEFMDNHKIVIPEFMETAFCNHLVVLMMRLTENECAEIEEDSISKGIEKSSIDLSKKMLKPLFIKYKLEPNYCEELLIAIYIQSSLKPLCA